MFRLSTVPGPSATLITMRRGVMKGNGRRYGHYPDDYADSTTIWNRNIEATPAANATPKTASIASRRAYPPGTRRRGQRRPGPPTNPSRRTGPPPRSRWSEPAAGRRRRSPTVEARPSRPPAPSPSAIGSLETGAEGRMSDRGTRAAAVVDSRRGSTGNGHRRYGHDRTEGERAQLRADHEEDA